MKRYVLLLTIVALLSSCASYRAYIVESVAARDAREKGTGPVFMDPPSYQEAFDTGRPAPEAFDAAMLWMNGSFVSARNVIQYSSREAGMITGKAMTQVDGGGEIVDIWYTITIEVKDGRARLSIQNVHPVAQDGLDLYYTAKMHEHFDLLARILLDTLKAELPRASSTW